MLCLQLNSKNNAADVHTLLDLSDTNGLASLSRDVMYEKLSRDVCAQTGHLIISN